MLRAIISISFIILAIIPIAAFSQQVEVDVIAKPLNGVIIDIAARYDLQVSFDDFELSKYKVTLKGTFDSPDAALHQLLRGLPFTLSKNGNVFIVLREKKITKPKTYTVSGQIRERGTLEPLPYAHVMINGNGLVSDLKGSFSYLASTDSVFRIQASHLGYYIQDTLVQGNAHLTFQLTPSIIGLSEVVIRNSIVERSMISGREAGLMKLNHQVAGFLPGFGDNSVFNLLRLQPGILAAGEQTNELIIWGCYEGQSKVLFDGFTIYGLKNFNDNISAFNPLMAKDIEVFKGGYDARFGERVGGIVNITGKNGNTERTSFAVNLNNMTLNGMVEIPVSGKGSLVIALRHTYYELYNPGDVNELFDGRNGRDSLNSVDLNIVPDYRFRDLNIKYSTRIKERDLFYVSLYGAADRFSYAVEEPVNNLLITKKTTEDNRQSGGSIFYGKAWRNGYSTNFSLSFSTLRSIFSDDLSVFKIQQQQTNQQKELDAENVIRENALQVDNRFPINEIHTLEGGMIYTANRVELYEDTFNVVQASFNEEARRMTLYFQDQITLLKNISLKAGFRMTQAINLGKFYFEPRVGLSVKAGNSIRFNAAWGIYNQYVTKSSIVDDLGNYRYIWTVCDNSGIPVLTSMHYVIGTSYARNDWSVNLEGYYKDVEGLTRYVRNTASQIEGIYEGYGRSYGIDLMIKKDYRWFSGWVAYSLSKTEEIFEYFKAAAYRRAPQDQRHEIKLAAMANFDPFYFSLDYVFGSGFPSSPPILHEEQNELVYSRLDAAFIYKFLDRRLKGEAGLSVLNVLNTQNIKYANYERISASQTNSVNIYSEAIPITPALYLKISL